MNVNTDPNYKKKFIDKLTRNGYKVSISDVSSHDEGVYWCAVDHGYYKAGVKKIQLQVKGEQHTRDILIRTELLFYVE